MSELNWGSRPASQSGVSSFWGFQSEASLKWDVKWITLPIPEEQTVRAGGRRLVMRRSRADDALRLLELCRRLPADANPFRFGLSTG